MNKHRLADRAASFQRLAWSSTFGQETLSAALATMRETSGSPPAKLGAVDGIKKRPLRRRHPHLFSQDVDVDEAEEALLLHPNEHETGALDGSRALGDTTGNVSFGKDLFREPVVRAGSAERAGGAHAFHAELNLLLIP